MQVSERWETTDSSIYINMNFTETREAVNFTHSGEQILNMTLINTLNSLQETGDNYVRNDTETREIDFVVNGKNSAKNDITMLGLRCISGTCPLDEIEELELEDG